MRPSSADLLGRLAELRTDYGAGSTERKLELLERLERRRLASATQVLRLHEILCFLQAYPDDAALLEQVESMLAAFDSRSDLRRHRRRLADSGVAGTEIRYRFYWVTARWLARKWPSLLEIDWNEPEHEDRLAEVLDLLLPYSETPALDMVARSPRQWIEQLKGADETDAAFLIRRFERFPARPRARERIYEQIDVPLKLSPGRSSPSRTRTRFAGWPVVFQRNPLERGRPDLKRQMDSAPRAVHPVAPRQADRLIDLARAAMVTRSRDLDAFAYADRRDVRLVEFAGGLRFAVFGLLPERRLMLEASYGFLTLKNGVPVGYCLASSLFASSEIAYNVFDSFRGAEAAFVFARLLSMVRHLFGSDAFAIDPYQLGLGNDEGLRSGAWWFYYKLGFRPHDPQVRRTLRGELARMRVDPGHRSSLRTLEKLAADYLHLYRDRPRSAVLGRISLGNIGLRVSERMAERFGADREGGVETCSREAARLLGLRSRGSLSPGERRWWRRWAPLVTILPGIESWTPSERRALAATLRAKGGQRESDFLRRFNRHPRLAAALLELSR